MTPLERAGEVADIITHLCDQTRRPVRVEVVMHYTGALGWTANETREAIRAAVELGTVRQVPTGIGRHGLWPTIAPPPPRPRRRVGALILPAAALLALAPTAFAATDAERIAALEQQVAVQQQVISLLLADRDAQWSALRAFDQGLRVQRDGLRGVTTRLGVVEYRVVEVNNRLVPLELAFGRVARRVAFLWRRR